MYVHTFAYNTHMQKQCGTMLYNHALIEYVKAEHLQFKHAQIIVGIN